MQQNQSAEDITHVCCIPFCQKNPPKDDKTFYFPFPHHDHELLKKWITQIGINQFKLTKNSHICSKHFVDADIDDHPNRKVPVLKSTAIPKIFNGYSPAKAIKLKDNDKNIVSINKKNVKIIKLKHDNIIEQIDDTDDIEIISHEIVLPKLKKPSVCYMSPVKQMKQKETSKSNTPPFVMIIPQFDKARAPSTVTKDMIKPRNALSTNKATLRITIGKKINNEEKQCKPIEKFQTKNEKNNTIVTYTLDPVTGDIKMTKEIQPATTPTTPTTTNSQVSITNRRKSRRIRRAVDSPALTTIADKVKNDLRKAEAESNDLEKHHKNLTETNEMLKNKKQKLQDDIEKMKDKVKRTLNDSPKVPINNKRKKLDNSLDKEHVPYETRTRKKIENMNVIEDDLSYETRIRKKIENMNVKDNLSYETRTRKKAQFNINNFSTPEKHVDINGSSTNKFNRENIINKIQFVDINKIKSAEMTVKLE